MFGRVYGFTDLADLHRGARDVLYHRARKALGDLATLHRKDGRIELRPRAAFCFGDPRCEPDDDVETLRAVAARGVVSVKELAATLGVPDRTAQDVLKRLVEEGALAAEQEGRRKVYRLEDTTFREPTFVGARELTR
ncbi:MAG: helix-turn-helix transcriptional regulator [Myxococcales bacterium]|nr:helix-turn-helix transcriptional regulator [Myxococcales bacterium]